ncbi:fork head domain-domain-containing protein [Syncephalastrum racemosum]|uniref:Fork head domain-domain-containing protein n=1 Tax=Syncephalastrum racemosum TaxID=13706 RepID=A0A1X2HWB1_SYNRA|nr:fork head domain-domain-containing protein [Syncephalastrum racemosum]
MDVFRLPFAVQNSKNVEYPPPIPVALRYPRLVGSVKQYRSDAQEQQLQHHIVSESFIPMAPELAKPPRKRRRPPFSYSSLIAQAILEAKDERMTLRDIYRWIMEKYPALYDADDTGWQNTIRHNLSLNKCFKKIPKSDLAGVGTRGKGGYWTVDPAYMDKFKNGAFAKGSSTGPMTRRKPPREIRSKPFEENSLQASGSSSFTAAATSSSSSPDTHIQPQQRQPLHPFISHPSLKPPPSSPRFQHYQPTSRAIAFAISSTTSPALTTTTFTSASATSSIMSNFPSATSPLSPTPSPTGSAATSSATSSSSRIMQIHHLLN